MVAPETGSGADWTMDGCKTGVLMTSLTLPSRQFACKPDFDECIARIYAWYEQRIIDRPPVRFHHHNVEYERHRTVAGPWKDTRQRWMDVEFQVKTFVDSLAGARLLGETFPVFWPNLSAVAYNLFLGQSADFDDVTAWTHPWVDDLDHCRRCASSGTANTSGRSRP